MTPDPAISPRPRPTGQGLALVGGRGTGKSTVGRIVARGLDRPFFDADHELEARAGRSVAAILVTDGEPAFREWEERTLAALIADFPTAIVATGGGVVLREENRRRLRAFGFVVWLTADPAELAQRLEADPRGLAARPALTPDGTIAEIARIIEVRTPLYRSVADVMIDTGGKSPDQVAEPSSDIGHADLLTCDPFAVCNASTLTRTMFLSWPILATLGLGFFLIGTVVGSFLNVCIYRIPWQKSVIWPSSTCPRCFGAIGAQDNIPIVSWIALRGECRSCGEPISVRYPLVEALVGLLFLGAFICDVICRPACRLWTGARISARRGRIPLRLSRAPGRRDFIDYDLTIIPDQITVTGMIVGIAMGTIWPGVRPSLLRATPVRPE